jgi:hypothetical protein
MTMMLMDLKETATSKEIALNGRDCYAPSHQVKGYIGLWCVKKVFHTTVRKKHRLQGSPYSDTRKLNGMRG